MYMYMYIYQLVLCKAAVSMCVCLSVCLYPPFDKTVGLQPNFALICGLIWESFEPKNN